MSYVFTAEFEIFFLCIAEKGCGHQDLTRQSYGLDGVKWPWVVSIGNSVTDGSWQHFCGGTLIDHNLVLTAAHCVQPAKDDNLK